MDLGFVKWYDTKGTFQLGVPFQSYYTDYTKTFPDWLLGYGTDNPAIDDAARYGERYFGGANSQDLMDLILSLGRANSELMSTTQQTDIEAALEQKMGELQRLEQQVYEAVGEHNFEGFCKLWYGQNTAVENKLHNYWLWRNLEFLTKSYQRIYANEDLTLVEQLFALYQIDFEKNGIECVDSDFRNEIKNELLSRGIVTTKDLEKSKRNNGKAYIPKGAKSEQEIFDAIGEIIKEKYSTKYTKSGEDYINASVQDVINKALSLDTRKSRIVVERKKKGEQTKLEPIKTIRSGFVKVNLQAPKNYKSQKAQVNYIVKQIINFLDRTRKMTFSEEEWQSWENYEEQLNGREKVEEKIRAICEEYFGNQELNKKVEEDSRLGPIGEIAAFGMSKYGLQGKNPDVNVVAIGNVYNQYRKQMAADLAIQLRIGGQKQTFGIQVKNPFRTDKGYYEMYKKTWNLGNEKSMNTFYQRVGFNENQRGLFEMLNANLNNMQRSYSAVLKDITDFLRYYSLELSRLDAQELTGKGERNLEALKKLDENAKSITISNLFYVLKGELIPSSEIVRGLLIQYRYILGKEKQESLTHSIKVNYYNTVDKNYQKISPDRKASGQFSKRQGKWKGNWGLKYNPDWVITGQKYRNLLGDIKFTTSLKLQIPSLSQLGILKKR